MTDIRKLFHFKEISILLVIVLLITNSSFAYTGLNDLRVPLINSTRQTLDRQKAVLATIKLNKELVDFLGEDYIKDIYNFDAQIIVASKLDALQLRPGRGAEPLTDSKFRELYSKERKTLGICIGGAFDGVGLVGFAAQRLSREQKPTFNVAYFSNLALKDIKLCRNGEKWILVAERGILIGDDGVAYYGKFPEPIQLDMIEHSGFGKKIRDKCTQHGIAVLNSSAGIEITSDKTASKKYCTDNDLKTPEYVSFDKEELGNLDLIEEKITRFAKEARSSDIVIKPTKESQGRGVIMLPSESIDEIRSNAIQILQKYGTVILERRIESYPYYNKDGQRLDWNIRLLASKSGVIDMEARVGIRGQDPINKSKGAEIMEVKNVFNSLRNSNGVKLIDIKDKIAVIAKKISQDLDMDFIGLDLIVDENGEPWIIEINGGAVGGMLSLAGIRQTMQEKLQAPLNFISLLLESFKSIPKSNFSRNMGFSETMDLTEFSVSDSENMVDTLKDIARPLSMAIIPKAKLIKLLEAVQLWKELFYSELNASDKESLLYCIGEIYLKLESVDGLSAKHKEQAARIAKQILKLDPSSGFGYDLFVCAGKGVDYIEEATKKYPKDLDFYFSLMNLYTSRDEIKMSYEVFKKIKEKAGSNSPETRKAKAILKKGILEYFTEVKLTTSIFNGIKKGVGALFEKTAETTINVRDRIDNIRYKRSRRRIEKQRQHMETLNTSI